jgi:hypothetical protein
MQSFLEVVLEWIIKQRKGGMKLKGIALCRIKAKSRKCKIFTFDYQYAISGKAIKNLNGLDMYSCQERVVNS